MCSPFELMLNKDIYVQYSRYEASIPPVLGTTHKTQPNLS